MAELCDHSRRKTSGRRIGSNSVEGGAPVSEKEKSDANAGLTLQHLSGACHEETFCVSRRAPSGNRLSACVDTIGCTVAAPPAQANALLITNTAPHQTVYQPTAPQNTQEQPMYPIPRTMFEEVIATYRIGYGHKAMYADLTGDQMWFIATSKFGKRNQQSTISEARPSCEDHAV